MRRAAMGAAVLMLGAVGCASTPVASTEQLVDSRVAIRTAKESGADKVPAAARHLQLAEEQNQLAQRELRKGDREEANRALRRAEADAELAIALAQEAPARLEAERARERIRALQQQSQTR